VAVEISELRELLSQLSLCAPIRIGLEAFVESRRGWVEGVNLLIRMEAVQDADSLLSIIERRGMRWRIVRRSERAFICVY
jgi:hypothetical protein